MGYDFDWSSIARAAPYLMHGMGMTAFLVAIAMSIGVALGTMLAIARLFGPRWLAVVSAGYVNLFRSIPLILTILWVYFLMPVVLRSVTGDPNLTVGPIYAAVSAFVLAESAYYCEIIRAGIGSVRSGQMAAGLSLGMTRWQVLRSVVLPQAFRNMTPVLLTQTIILFQDTSLVYVISVTDFLGAAAKIANRDYRLIEMYTFAAVVYFIISFSLSLVVKKLQAKMAIIR